MKIWRRKTDTEKDSRKIWREKESKKGKMHKSVRKTEDTVSDVTSLIQR